MTLLQILNIYSILFKCIHVSEYASVKFVEEMISNMKEKYIFTLSEPEDNKDINQNN